MNIRYKLTDADGFTRNHTKWGEIITHETDGNSDELCNSHWIHVYSNPFLAILLNPIHANFHNPILWECHCEGKMLNDYGLKEGWTKVTTIRQLPIPQITKEQKIIFAILCAKEVYTDPDWNKWADNWLNNSDRSKNAAVDATNAAAAYAAAYAAAAEADAAAAYAIDGGYQFDSNCRESNAILITLDQCLLINSVGTINGN